VQVVFLKNDKSPVVLFLSLFYKEINHEYKGCSSSIHGLNFLGIWIPD